MNTMLKVENISKFYESKSSTFKAVDDISFEIDSGQIVSLLGPNGAGKTTIVSMIGSYLLPTKGKIFIDGINITSKNAKSIPKVGIVFGGELGFYGRATAKENLHFFADLDDIPYRKQDKEINRVLSMVELLNAADKKVNQFSKGMIQRLHIARALLGSPKLMLLDEPTSGLDVEIARNIRHIIKKLAKKGVAILLTSHTMEEVAELADNIILLGNGKKYYEGTTSEIIDLSEVKHIDRKATLEESYLALAPELRRNND